MQSTIGVITPKYLDKAAATHHRAWQAAYAGVFPADYLARHTLEAFRETWREMFVEQVNGYSCLLGAIDANENVVGVARVGFYDRPRKIDDLGDCVSFSHVYVDRHREGIGSELMAAAHKVGARMLGKNGGVGVLWVAKMNEGQEKFYLRLGWEERDRSFEDRGSESVEVTRFTRALEPSIGAMGL